MTGLLTGKSQASRKLSLAFYNTIGKDGLSGFSKKEGRVILRR
jgi:hypothetical protein